MVVAPDEENQALNSRKSRHMDRGLAFRLNMDHTCLSMEIPVASKEGTQLGVQGSNSKTNFSHTTQNKWDSTIDGNSYKMHLAFDKEMMGNTENMQVVIVPKESKYEGEKAKTTGHGICKDISMCCFHEGEVEEAKQCEKPRKIVDGEGGLSQGKSTFFQATLNCVSMLYGLGILSSPFAVAQAGWMGAIIALAIATAYAYGAYLMAKCVKGNMSCGGGTYQEVARAALGGRVKGFITTLFYVEILGTLVGYCISVGDNLAYIFPNAAVGLPGLSGRNFMIFVAAMVMLPSVWLRDLSALSFTSMWCIASTILLLLAILLSATVNHIGFHHPIPFLRPSGVPVAAGLYAFSFGGTSVFPSICISMKDPSKFTKALVISFLIATASMVGLGIVGAYMFGDHTASQITLSMPVHFITTKIILWMTVVTPMFKFALQLSPITTALEACLNNHCKKSKSFLYVAATLMRSMVLATIAVFAMIFPYFEYIVAFVGSSMTIAICLLLPCIFYLKLFWSKLGRKAITMIGALIFLGFVVGACGTIISVQGLISKRKSGSNP